MKAFLIRIVVFSVGCVEEFVQMFLELILTTKL